MTLRSNCLIDVATAVLIVLALSLVADWRAQHPGPSQWMKGDFNRHLGAEHDEIARSIRAGEGFSSPFRVSSGPTAWMPPVLPYILAACYWVTDDDARSVVDLILVAKSLVLILTGVITLAEARTLGLWKFGVGAIVVGYGCEFYYLFQVTHDVWLIMLVLDCVWMCCSVLRSDNHVSSVLWGGVGGVALLCSPVVGLVWGVITIAQSRSTKQRRSMLLAVIFCVVIATPWCVRNRVVLGKWIPIKSNGVYEVWQSLCVDEDGVLDLATIRQHPYSSSNRERQHYVEIGEIQFVGEKTPAVLAKLQTQPLDFAERILARFIAACQYYSPLDKRDEQLWSTSIHRTLFFLPFLFWCVLIVSFRWQPRRAKVAVLIYASYLCPYILISFYDRYGAPLIGIKLLLIVYGVATCRGALTRRHVEGSCQSDVAGARRETRQKQSTNLL